MAFCKIWLPLFCLAQVLAAAASSEDCCCKKYVQECCPEHVQASDQQTSQNVPGKGFSISGILLVGREESIEKRGVESFEGVQVRDLELPGRLYDLCRCLEPYYKEKELTSEDLLEIKRQIILYYRGHYRPVITVEIPKQDVTGGVLQVLVLESRVGDVIVKCNKWYSDARIRNYISLCPGDVIDSDCLLNDVAWANRSPFRATDVVFSPGKCEGTTDIELVTKDRLPFRPYVGGDNGGTTVLGNARLFTGFQWGNFFGLDDLFSYQYTTTTHFRRLQAHSLQYYAPLPWKHEFIAFGGYAKIKSDFSDFRLKGRSFQASLRYGIPIKPLYGPFSQNIIFGFDFKNTDNNLLFVGENLIPIVTGTVNITQFVASYDLFKMFERAEFVFLIEAIYSPGRLVDNQKKSDFEKLRPKAKSDYVYGRGEARVVYRPCSGYSLAAQVRGQGSSRELLPSEQYGLGGFETVRAYDERAFNADNAVNVNAEIRSWAIKIFEGGRLSRLNDELIFLAFVDYGWGHNWSRTNSDKRTEWLLGVGPGLRYAINPYLSFRFDWGIKLHRTQFDRDWSKFHLGLLASY